MSYVWKFSPEEKREEISQPIVRPPKKKNGAWVAPEHAKMASDMKRDFPRNEKGERIGDERNLVLDKRPRIMIPPRPVRIGNK